MSTIRLSDLDFAGGIYEFEDLLAQNRLDHLTYPTLTAMEEDTSLEVNDSAVVNGGIFDVHEVIDVENEEEMTDPDTIYYYNGTHYYGNNGGEAIGFETVNGFAMLNDKNVFVTPEMFGAKGDGVTDDSDAVQATLNSGAKRVVGLGTYLLQKRVIIDSAKNMTVDGLHVISLNGTSPTDSTFDIKNGAENITITNCTFEHGISCVHLFDCDNITVSNNKFIETGYAIIQEAGYSSNDVRVIGNNAQNLIRDFVECNCEVEAPSKNWVISNNTYSHDVTSAEYINECRFVGITAVENVNISDNIVNNARGNAIHMEDVGGQTIIANNVILDTVGYDVDIESGYKSAIITGNYIKNTIPNKSMSAMINLSAGGSSAGEYNIVIDSNIFEGNGTQSNPLAISSSTNYTRQITNNKFKGFDILFGNENRPFGNIIRKLNFTGNSVESNYFIKFIQDTSIISTIKQAVFDGNQITGQIYLSDNGNGSLTPDDVIFTGNVIDGNVTFNACNTIIFTNNVIANNHLLVVTSTPNFVKNGSSYQNSLPIWKVITSGTYSCTNPHTLEPSGLTFTVPENETYAVYVTGSYSNSITESYAITTGASSLDHQNLTKFDDCGQKSPVCICTPGTYHVYVAQATSGSNLYRIHAKSI